jgi:hypothetical protein
MIARAALMHALLRDENPHFIGTSASRAKILARARGEKILRRARL